MEDTGNAPVSYLYSAKVIKISPPGHYIREVSILLVGERIRRERLLLEVLRQLLRLPVTWMILRTEPVPSENS